MHTNLNELIEAGRNSAVAVSFTTQTADRLSNTVDKNAQNGYPSTMDEITPSDEKGRRKSRAIQSRSSERSNVRIDVAIIEAARAGAKSLRSLATALNEARVETRRKGGEWTDKLAAVELGRMGYSIKALNAQLSPPDGGDLTKGSALSLQAEIDAENMLKLSAFSARLLKNLLKNTSRRKPVRYSLLKIIAPKNMSCDAILCPEHKKLIDSFLVSLVTARPQFKMPSIAIQMCHEEALVWSQEAFLKVVQAERDLADSEGEWVSASELPPRQGDLIQHSDRIIGTYFDGEDILRCKSRAATGRFEPSYCNRTEAKVFRWKDGFNAEDHKSEFAKIRRKHVKAADLVEPSRITPEQRLARLSAIRWPYFGREIDPVDC